MQLLRTKIIVALVAAAAGVGCHRPASETPVAAGHAVNVPAGGVEPLRQATTGFEQGALENTGADLDVAISGEGFFCIKLPNEINDGVGYTRNGNFFRSMDGKLVVGLGDGYAVQPEIKLPGGATRIRIEPDGSVVYRPTHGSTVITAGRLTLTRFAHPEKLKPGLAGSYTPTPESGRPVEGSPGSLGLGTTLQGFLESRDFDPQSLADSSLPR